MREQQEFEVLSRRFTRKIKGFLGKTPDTFPHATILSDIDYLVDNEFDAKNNELGWALRSLEAYCKEHKTGFIEAADLVIPPTGEVFGHFDNFRATFLDHHLQNA